MFIITVLSLVAAILIVFMIGKVVLSIQVEKQVTQLFSNAKSGSGKTYTQEQLFGLPQPVQHYFAYVLKKGNLI